MFKQAGTASHEPYLGAAYQVHLIDLLSDEHKLLLNGLDNSRQFLAHFKIADFEREIKLFKGRFQSHIMAENLKLYLYLRMSLPQGSEQKKLAENMRLEIKEIGKRVKAFHDTYGSGQLSPALIYACETELTELRKLLSERFEQEERSLYPLYKRQAAA